MVAVSQTHEVKLEDAKHEVAERFGVPVEQMSPMFNRDSQLIGWELTLPDGKRLAAIVRPRDD